VEAHGGVIWAENIRPTDPTSFRNRWARASSSACRSETGMTAAHPVPLSRWADRPDPQRIHVHASAVALDGMGVLICGASGSGKSTLALELMALGADLIADDGIRIDLGQEPGSVPFLERPDTATDLIESRGIGLLRAGSIHGRAPLELVIDLDTAEPERLPPRRNVTTGSVERPLILGAGHPSLAVSVAWMLRHGRDMPGEGETP
jgi:HPr kinase/phosphorylase